jgi:hypothetical protein
MPLVYRGPSPWLPQTHFQLPQDDIPLPQDDLIDQDKDGIPDYLEEALLKRFRPYYKFSEKDGLSENYRPTDPIWQMKYATLKDDECRPGSESNIVDTGHYDSEGNPDGHIEPSELLTYCGGDTDLTKNRRATYYCLDIADDKRGGPEWDDAKKYAPGLYGHVVPLDDFTGYYKIEYWQYFAYSGVDAGGDIGDHEGDWCTVQLWYNNTTDKLARVSHYHHGDESTFLFTKDTISSNIQIDGVEMVEYYDPSFMEKLIKILNEYRRRFWDPEFWKKLKELWKESWSENSDGELVRFFIDDEGNKHVVVYIERDGHEFWPTESGSKYGANEHNGKGLSYLTAYDSARPLNLGEVENPLSEDARIIMCFNGRWGCWHKWSGNNPPPGPTLHKEWLWPLGSVLRRAIDDNNFES